MLRWLEFTDCQFGVDEQAGRDDIAYGILR